MLMQYLPPEQRKGEQRYKRGDFIMYDNRPTDEEQQQLIDYANRNGITLKKCPVCNRYIPEYGNVYCSDRCKNDAYIERRHQRHEEQLQKICVVCGKEFTAKRTDTKYCSNACKQSAYRRMKVTDNRFCEITKSVSVTDNRCAKFGTSENSNNIER